MVVLNVSQLHIDKAKQLTAEFDKKKGYNKFPCPNNYIGIMGELILAEYFEANNIIHEWVGVNKGVMNSPDFIMCTGSCSKTVDLKTTYSDKFWFQAPTHDIYIYARLAKNSKTIDYVGYIDKETLKQYIINGTANTVIRGNRADYTLDPKHLIMFNNNITFK